METILRKILTQFILINNIKTSKRYLKILSILNCCHILGWRIRKLGGQHIAEYAPFWNWAGCSIFRERYQIIRVVSVLNSYHEATCIVSTKNITQTKQFSRCFSLFRFHQTVSYAQYPYILQQGCYMSE